jgi:hypothetical protein
VVASTPGYPSGAGPAGAALRLAGFVWLWRWGVPALYRSTPSSTPPESQARSWLGVTSTWWTGK